MRTKDERRLATNRRVLAWGTPLIGLLFLRLSLPLEEIGGLWLLFHLRGEVPPPAEVVVIAIDEETEDALGVPIENARAVHAELVDTLSEAGASVIVFDISFNDNSGDDAAFAEAIAESRNVILKAGLDRSITIGIEGNFSRQQLQQPAEAIANSALIASPWLVPEDTRVDWVQLRDDADRPMLPFAALQYYRYDELIVSLQRSRPDFAARFPASRTELGSPPELEMILEALRSEFVADPALGTELTAEIREAPEGWRSIVDINSGSNFLRGNRVYLNYYGPPRTIETVPYQDAIGGRFNPGDLAGKAVFVGYSALQQPGQRDTFPFIYTVDGFQISGVEIAATAFSNLLNETYLKLPTDLFRALIVIGWGALIVCCFNFLRIPAAVVAVALLSVIYITIAEFVFQSQAIWVPIVLPASQLLFAGAVLTRAKQLADRVQLSDAVGEEAALALTGRAMTSKVTHEIILFTDEVGSKKRVLRDGSKPIHPIAKTKNRFARLWAMLKSPPIAGTKDAFDVACESPVTANGGAINHHVGDNFKQHLGCYWNIVRSFLDAK